MFVRLFRDMDAVDTTAPITTETPSLASLMAKSGVVNSSEEMAAQPILNTEKNEEPVKPTEATPAEPATEPVKTQGQQETPAEQTPVFGAKPQIEEPAKPTEVAWQEVLKVQQPEAVLKELGFDDKMVAFLNHWKSSGDVKDYLRELSTDYSKMPAEDVMRHQLRREYPKASEKAIELLYQEEIVDKYKIDPDVYTEEEVERGRLLLETKSEKYREDFAKQQQNFLLSPPPEKSTAPDPQVLEQQAERKRQDDLYISTMSSSDLTRQLLTEKKLTFGDGDSKFSFPVDPQALTDILLDYGQFKEATYDKVKDQSGKDVYVPNARKQWLFAAVAKYGDTFLDEYAKHYMALGASKTIAPIENAVPPANNNIVKSIAPTGQTAAAMMAKQGRVVG
jgi:hypothetical protein